MRAAPVDVGRVIQTPVLRLTEHSEVAAASSDQPPIALLSVEVTAVPIPTNWSSAVPSVVLPV
jgi:hypothetical protein